MTTVIAFPTGVGKTAALVYHLAHMVARLGWRVLAADLDPQANLTSAFFDEEQLERLWDEEGTDTAVTLVGDARVPVPQEADDRLWVLPGDLRLSRFEDLLAASWPLSCEGDEGALHVTTAFHRILQRCAADVGAHVVFIDVGPNLSAINRSALIACDALLVPLAADLFSLHGLRILGPALRQWRSEWGHAVLLNAPAEVAMPAGTMRPLGYVVLQRAARLDRPFRPPLHRFQHEFHHSVLGESNPTVDYENDPYKLASLRSFTTLMPLAQDAHKPMFDLKPADGAMGSTGRLVHLCYREFRDLAVRLMNAAEIPAA